MAKRIVRVVSSLACLVCLLVACDPRLNSVGLVLPNGVIVSEQEKAILEGLTPRAEAIFSSVLGDTRSRSLLDGNTEALTSAEREELTAQMTAMLKEQFGEDYEKYIIVTTFGYAEEVTYAPADGARFGVTDGLDAVFQYTMIVECGNTLWPWSTWNWARTKHVKTYLVDGETVRDLVQSIRCYLRDSVTPEGEDVRLYDDDFVNADGNAKFGFFPTIPGDIYTEHEVWDECIWNGHILRSYAWPAWR